MPSDKDQEAYGNRDQSQETEKTDLAPPTLGTSFRSGDYDLVGFQMRGEPAPYFVRLFLFSQRKRSLCVRGLVASAR